MCQGESLKTHFCSKTGLFVSHKASKEALFSALQENNQKRLLVLSILYHDLLLSKKQHIRKRTSVCKKL